MPFKPTKAGKVDTLAELRFPVLASPKLDGIRAVVHDGIVKSLSLKPIPNQHIQQLFGRPEFNGLDGELIIGSPTDPDAFNNTTGAVRRASGTPAVGFHVFDDFINPTHPFEARLKEVLRKSLNVPTIHAVPHILINNSDAMEQYINECLSAGYEGAMTRSLDGPYKFGRSTAKEQWLIKHKLFEDGEAVVIGFTEMMHNANEAKTNELGRTQRSTHQENMIPTGSLGTLIVQELDTGIDFEIGTGFTAKQRQEIWDDRFNWLNKIVKFKHQAHGRVNKPRLPVFLGERLRIDISDK